jgi:hypothetical protein
MRLDDLRHGRIGFGRAVLTGGLALATALSGIGTAAAAPVGSAAPAPARGDQVDFGANVKVFDPGMSRAQIQAVVDAVAAEQVSNQFGTQRYALLFKPGTYGSVADPLTFKVGYYTEVAGLGRAPTDVTVNGAIDVANQCFPTPPGAPTDCTALVNFWRSLSNLTINVTGQSGCQSGTEFWAVSQASSMRRVQVTGGNLSLMDYCSAGPQYASGGFIADSAFSGGTVINGSQQQFLTRNSSLDGWTNGVWNQVFAGVDGAPAQSFPNPPYTTLERTPAAREKPYLYLDGSGRYNVFVPRGRSNSRGTTWQDGPTAGRSIPIRDFYLARPGDRVATINAALARGKNLIFTPGGYDIDRTITVRRPGTIVLGLGVATLTAEHGAVPLAVADVPGVDIAGLMIDAGPVNSPVLLQVGTRHAGPGRSHRHCGDPADPTGIQDVYFRVGGPHAGKASVSLEINSDNVILDDIWAWRADHGNGVGWTVNTAATGFVVNGDDVTATGLFVEHYQQDNVIWNGEHGTTIMFQNELPYDAPTQADWAHDGIAGFAAYKVDRRVRTHEGWGLGSYIWTNVNPSLHASNAFEVPATAGIAMHDLLTVSLNGAGTIDHVVNGIGDPVTPTHQGPSTVLSYP